MTSEKVGINHQFVKCPHCGIELVLELGKIKVVTLQDFQKQVKEVIRIEKAAGTL